MIILNSDVSDELQKECLRMFFMVELGFSTIVRYNDTEESISDSLGNVFLPRSFTFPGLGTSSGMTVSQLDIDIDNTDQVISTYLLGEDVRNTIAKLYLGVVTQKVSWAGDEVKTEIITQEFFRGIIGGWTLSEDNKALITIKNELILWNKKALRTQSSSCPWSFKGVECQYAGGESWCDQSYDRCLEMVNTDNFGGFRFLPSIMEKELWWGRSQSL